MLPNGHVSEYTLGGREALPNKGEAVLATEKRPAAESTWTAVLEPGHRGRIHSVAEDSQASTLVGSVAGQLSPCPLRMLKRIEVGIGMGHQSEQPAGWIADSRNCLVGAVGVGRPVLGRDSIVIHIADSDLMPLL